MALQSQPRLPHGVYLLLLLLLLFVTLFFSPLSLSLPTLTRSYGNVTPPLVDPVPANHLPVDTPRDIAIAAATGGSHPSSEVDSLLLLTSTSDRHLHEQDPKTRSSIKDLQVGTVPRRHTPCPLSAGASDLIRSDSLLQLMKRKALTAIAVLSSLIVYVSVNSLIRTINPSAFIWSDEDKEEPRWIASSDSWADRKACRWIGLCGASHFRLVSAKFGHRVDGSLQQPRDEGTPWRSFWYSGADTWDESDSAERARREIPGYVFEYAPLVHLASGEQFWPCDIAEHLYHITPTLDYTPIQSRSNRVNLTNLDRLNEWEVAREVFLTSDDNVERRPPWLEGERNIPESSDDLDEPWADWDGRIDGNLPDINDDQMEWAEADVDGHRDSQEAVQEASKLLKQELRKRYGGQKVLSQGKKGGRSSAPAVLLVLDKGNGVVDAFWFYFYSFNLGNVVFNVRFGNHIGDWEHCLVRFYKGQPKALFFSAHSAGEAYSYEAVEKIGKRVSYGPRLRFIVQWQTNSTRSL